ncbi:MAG: hypothetical protein WDO69_11840 [Pseudomonadota bacterium]
MDRKLKFAASSKLHTRSLTRLAPFATLLALAACSSVLGIEDLHEGPAPGGAGDDAAGDNGTGGSVVNGGGAAMTAGSSGNGQGGTTGNAGNSGSGANGGSMTTGGGSGNGTGGAVADAGAGGEAPQGSSVHGHVIDYWGRKLGNVPVEIDGTLVTTDELGAFVIDDVAPEYDVSLTVEFPDNYDGEHFGWVFQGLTRRDPTLQVYAGLELHSGNLDIIPSNASATLTGTRTMTIAMGGPDGSDEFTDASAGGYDGISVYWRGLGTASETAHGLIWQATAGVPTGYYAYDKQLVALDGLSTNHSMVTLDMSAKTIASGNIAGTVTANGGKTRANGVFLQFTSNAIMTLAQDNGPATFSYLVPTIANSSVIFSASEGSSDEGDAYYGAYAVAHKDTLAAGVSGISVSIPKPATLLTEMPASSKDKVDSNTVFSFQGGAGSAGLYVVAFRQPDNSALRTDGLFVVTTKKSFKMPKVVNDGFALDPGASYYWRVETHGSFATTDAATSATGYLDEFSGDFYGLVPVGPRRGDGSFTISDYSDLITMAH